MKIQKVPNINIADLEDTEQYTLLDTLQHSDIKEFVVRELEPHALWARIANMYQIGGLLAFMLAGFRAFMPFFVQKESIFLMYFLFGTAFSFTVLIILHELIHAMAYKVIGAKNISYGIQLQKFLFYVQANKQVLNYNNMKIVALAPAVVVAVITIVGMAVFYQHPLFYSFAAVFGLHSLFCAGDMGILSYFANRNDKEIVTYDDKENDCSYFYLKKSKE
jgi:hypothetical protein